MNSHSPLSIRAVLLTILFAVVVAGMWGPAKVSAHNEFVESTPVEGAQLTVPPEFWEVTFTKDVPLETASGEVVNSNGVRTPLPTPTHGATTNVIRFSMPPELTGAVTARWKLVSEDGHVVQGRVNFAISTNTTTQDSTSSLNPAAVTSVAPTNNTTDNSSMNSVAAISNPAPEPVRWAVRSMGFAALMLMGGLIFVERALSISSIGLSRGLLFARTSAIALTAVPFLQNLFLVGDIRNSNVFSALPHFLSTFDLTYGAMLITQTLIGLAVTYIVFTSATHLLSTANRLFLIALFFMYLTALAFSGHSRTMSWPVLGIPADIAHTGAAAVWLGGLAVLALLVIPNVSIAQSVSAYRQFGFFARYAVITIVITGVIQTLRLHGDIASLFTESHGRILLLKIIAVAAMLKVADINRRRLLRHLDPDAPVTEKRIGLLWRASMTEIATGGMVIAITAVLVTSSFS